jgi:hypothetical protein
VIVFELYKALQFNGAWHRTGGSRGELYANLPRAQAQVVDAGAWVKRERQRAWDTERGDMILERKVKP